MATKPITDGKPVSWYLKGGRHNALSRHRGEHGLWYMVGMWGSGRYQDGWSITVFPDRVKPSGYAGSRLSAVMPESMRGLALLDVSGKGGYDRGKGHSSKGGFRAGGSITYVYGDKEFDPALLDDGDEFLRQVLGYEPTVEGIAAGKAADEAEARRRITIERIRLEEMEFEWESKRKAAEEEKAAWEVLFSGVPEAPENWFKDVERNGLHVWQTGPGWGRWMERIFTEMVSYLAWREEVLADQAEQARKNAEWLIKKAEQERLAELHTTAVTTQMLSMKERLAQLKK